MGYIEISFPIYDAQENLKEITYRVARKFCGSFILQIGDFLWFAGTNYCGSRRLKFLLGTNFCDALVQAAE